jgi:hypothetical protein
MKTTFAIMGLLIMGLFAAGCEKTTTRAVIDISPEAAAVEAKGAVTFTASIPEAERETRQLYYPLDWQVSNPGLGSVRQTAGDTAVYVAGDSEGINTITVRDQAGAEGVAAITQD